MVPHFWPECQQHVCKCLSVHVQDNPTASRSCPSQEQFAADNDGKEISRIAKVDTLKNRYAAERENIGSVIKVCQSKEVWEVNNR